MAQRATERDCQLTGYDFRDALEDQREPCRLRACQDPILKVGPVVQIRSLDRTIRFWVDGQLTDRVSEHCGRGGPRERHERWVSTASVAAESPKVVGQAEIGSPEVMAPLGDTMTFIDDDGVDELLVCRRAQMLSEPRALQSSGVANTNRASPLATASNAAA